MWLLRLEAKRWLYSPTTLQTKEDACPIKVTSWPAHFMKFTSWLRLMMPPLGIHHLRSEIHHRCCREHQWNLHLLVYTILLSYDWNDPHEQGLQVQIDSSNIQNSKNGNWDWRCKEDILINAKWYATKKAIRRDERKAIRIRNVLNEGLSYTYLWKETHCDWLYSGSDSGEKNFGLVLSRCLHSCWIDCFMCWFVKQGSDEKFEVRFHVCQ